MSSDLHPAIVAPVDDIVGALIEFDELCPGCRRRVLLLAPKGDGDLEPTRFHEELAGAVCTIGETRGDRLISTARVDELLGVELEEGPTQR